MSEHDLNHYRKEIDALDKQLVDMLVTRMGLIRKAAEYKHRHDLPAIIMDRVHEVRDNAANYAGEKGLSPRYIADLWTRIIAESCFFEEENFDRLSEKR